MATAPADENDCGCTETTPMTLEEIAANAEQLHVALQKDDPLELPEIDFDSLVLPEDVLANLTREVKPLELASLTEVKVGGNGVFDKLLASLSLHLQNECRQGFIDKSKYAEVYVQLFPAALSESVRFVLEKDTTYLATLRAQLDAQTSRVMFETAKMGLAEARYRALRQEADWASAKVNSLRASTDYAIAQHKYKYDAPLETCILNLRMSNQDTQNDLLEHELTQMRPLQVEQMVLQRAGMELANEGAALTNDHNALAMPTQRLILGLQRDNQELVNTGQEYSNSQAEYTLNEMLPQQLILLTEQTETQRANTSDVRLDGSPVTGAVGKQKELQSQQITSYQHDSRVKTASIFSNSWVAQKGIDPELQAPEKLQNASVNLVLTELLTGNAI